MKEIKYVLLAINDEATAQQARAIMMGNFARGWELFQVIDKGNATNPDNPSFQNMQILHILLRDTVYPEPQVVEPESAEEVVEKQE